MQTITQIGAFTSDTANAINANFAAAAPATPSGAVQYDNAGAFAASPNLMWNSQVNELSMGTGLGIVSGVTAVLATGGALTAGTPYYYIVTAVTNTGETSQSAQVSATPTSGNQTVNLTWNAFTGANSYNIYRSTASGSFTGASLAGNAATPSFSDGGAALTAGAPPGALSCNVSGDIRCSGRITIGGTSGAYYSANLNVGDILALANITCTATSANGASLYLGDQGFNTTNAQLAPGLSAVYDANTTHAGALGLFSYASGSRTEKMRILGNGNVGIGLTAPTHQLHLSTDDAAKLTTSSWTIASGAAVKQNVQDLEGGIDIIDKLRPTVAEYNGKAGTLKGKRVVSLIAEEVEKVLPHTVTRDADGNLGFNPHEVIFHLILAVQQLSQALKEKCPAAI